MPSLLAIIGCFLLYRTSKYFSNEIISLESMIRFQKWDIKIIGSFFLLVSAILSIIKYGLGTGLLIFFATVIFGLCFIMIVIPLNRIWVYLLAGIYMALIVFENII